MERYERILKISEKKLQENCPVIFEKGALLKDNKFNRNVLQLQFKNIGLKRIKAVYIIVSCLDIEKKHVEIVEKKYLDLSVTYAGVFGANQPIQLTSDFSRNYEFSITKVIFADDTILDCSGKMNAIELPCALEDIGELKDQFVREVCDEQSNKTDCKVKPIKQQGFWRCTCGALNYISNEECGKCAINCEKLFSLLSYDYLKERYEEYLKKKECEEKERQFQERKKAEELKAKAEIRKKKQKKIKKILLIIMIIAVVFGIIYGIAIKYIIPEIKYFLAIETIENGEYENGYAILEELGNYKDSEEQIKSWKYKQATAALEEAEYRVAIQIFEEIGEYKDSLSNLKEAKYLYAKKYLDNSDMNDAVRLLVQIEEYKDSKELCENTEYGQMRSCVDSDPQKAIAYFESKGAALPNAEELLLEAKANYVVNNLPKTCEEYIKVHPYMLELKENDYKDFSRIYDSYFPKIFMFVNSDKEDIYIACDKLEIDADEEFYLHLINIGTPVPGDVLFEDKNTGIGANPSVKWKDFRGNVITDAKVNTTYWLLRKDIFDNNDTVDLSYQFLNSSGEVVVYGNTIIQ